MSADRVRAATLVAPGRYEIREYPLPEPGPGCAVVRMSLSGICGTDKHTYQGYTTQYAGTQSARAIPFPIIQGHENVGTIAALGPLTGGRPYTDFDGQPLRVGDRVVVGANVVCGTCYYCRHDFPYFACENMTDYGNNLSAAEPPHLFGGWAEYIYILPGAFLVKVPDELPTEIAALTEVMAVSVGLDRAKQMSVVPSEAFLFDDTVVVLGVGPLGMCFLMKARMLGAGVIVAIDLSPYRLDMARRLGADHVLDARETTTGDRLEFVRAVTHGRGADVVVECAGVPQVIPEALDLLRVGGLLVEAGNFSDLGDVAINPHRHLCSKGIRILGVGGEEPAAYGPSLRQMARYLRYYPLRELVSHRYGLETVEAAVTKAISPDSMKVVIDPWA
jgi:threonine dehydrogenase-like Zn-dependent dehydrogenase